MSAENFFAIEPYIVSRIRERCEGVREVFAVADFAAALTHLEITPCVFIIYDGYRTHDATTSAAQLTQRWNVIPAVRNLNHEVASDHLREAGIIVGQVIDALHGWQPDGIPQYRPLRLAGGATPVFSDGAYLCPFVFETGLIVRGST